MSFWVPFTILAIKTLLCAGLNGKSRMQANPIRKITNMLQDMQHELEREGEVEKELFAKALCACEGGEKQLQQTVADSSAAIEGLSSKVKAETAEKTGLEQDVKDHKTAKAAGEKDLAHATMLREKEAKAFSMDEKDTALNVKNLGLAITAIEKGMGASALVQMPDNGLAHLTRMVEITKLISSDERTNVLAFLAQAQGTDVQAPQSGEIVGILKNMLDEMTNSLAELRAEETKNREGYDDLKAAKASEIDANKNSIIEKEKRVGALALSISQAANSLDDAQEELTDAQNFLANMKEECATMEKNRDIRLKMRTEEIAAIGEAIKILSDDDALDVFKKALPGAALVQHQQTYDALLQLTRKDVTVKVRHTAKNKLMLLSLNERSRTVEEPGGPVTEEHVAGAQKVVATMVTNMIAGLHDEDVADEHKKAWCVNETTVQHQIETEKKTLIEKTTATIADLEDQIAGLTEAIKMLESKINDMDKMVHEATVQRKEEHQEFVDELATMASAVHLIGKAKKRLEKFYSPKKYAADRKAEKDAAFKAAGIEEQFGVSLLHSSVSQAAVKRRTASLMQGVGEIDSFVQRRQTLRMRVAPVVLPTTPGTYEKKESGGVIGLMTQFETDLKTDMTESETEEKHAAQDYTRIMKDAHDTRAQDVKSLHHDKASKATLSQKMLDDKTLLKSTIEELHNLQLYLSQLHVECDFLMKNFEVRHEGRVDEELGLENTRSIMTKEEPPDHREVEGKFESETADEHVAEHFPGSPYAEE